jgi:hypothetical protein
MLASNAKSSLRSVFVAAVLLVFALATPAAAQPVVPPISPPGIDFQFHDPFLPFFPAEPATSDRIGGLLRGPSREEPRPRPGPNVPEPMVFDLIRPLGVRRGELEVNVLGFVPLRRTRARTPQFSFISGADQSTEKRPAFEWAPEIEYGLFDNFAVEFELPMALGSVEAYKGAVQYTLGTGFNEQFIHGFQGILFIDRTNWAVTPTVLYLAAVRFDPVYSLLGMVGFSHEFGGDNPRNPSQILVNATLFAEASETWTFGLEANYAAELDGAALLLLMPQAHWNVREDISIQFGVGTRASEGNFTGEAAFRLVRSF